MIIGLASPSVALSLEDGLEKVRLLMSEASSSGAEIVCFPEAYVPGLRGQDFDVFPFDQEAHERVWQASAQWAQMYQIAVILGTERLTDVGRQIAAYVIDSNGKLLGYQTKNQLDPTEDPYYVPGETRQIFEIKGMKFGISICHEGFRYPETVRWAAVRGAKIVFHPHLTGSDRQGISLTRWGDSNSPYYEKAMMCRSIENGIYLASVNYGLRYQESATCVIAPSGECQAYLPYGENGLLVQEIKPEEVSGVLASRFAPDRYKEC